MYNKRATCASTAHFAQNRKKMFLSRLHTYTEHHFRGSRRYLFLFLIGYLTMGPRPLCTKCEAVRALCLFPHFSEVLCFLVFVRIRLPLWPAKLRYWGRRVAREA
jgi:hypothetical protein